MLGERGDVPELTRRADRGDWQAACSLAELRAERGELDELR
jgi:hypothetical protein